MCTPVVFWKTSNFYFIEDPKRVLMLCSCDCYDNNLAFIRAMLYHICAKITFSQFLPLQVSLPIKSSPNFHPHNGQPCVCRIYTRNRRWDPCIPALMLFSHSTLLNEVKLLTKFINILMTNGKATHSWLLLSETCWWFSSETSRLSSYDMLRLILKKDV